MKATATLLLGILVVLSFGVLWSLHNPAKSAPISQMQQFTGKEDHQIDLGAAVRLIKNHKSNPKVPSHKGGFFARVAFEKILAQQGVVGIRYYYAQKDEGTPTILLVGVDEKGEDIQTGVIMEKSIECPPICPFESELAR